MKKQGNRSGFTLIELVITITIILIIFSITGIFISNSMHAYAGIMTRASLVDIAEIAIRRIERDLRQALPNSIRVKVDNGRTAIEMVNVIEVMRYRASTPGGSNNVFTIDNSVKEFDVLENFLNAKLGTNNYRLVVYNTGANYGDSDQPVAGVNVYATDPAIGPNPSTNTHVITPTMVQVTLDNNGNIGHITLSQPFQFAFQSPQQRVYIIDTPISYICDTTNQNGTITQYKNYKLSPIQAALPANLPLSSASSVALLANNVASCSFNYQVANSQRNGLVTIQLTVSDGTQQITLLHQVGIINAP